MCLPVELGHADPPDAAALTRLIAAAGLAPRQALRRKEPAYAEHNLADPALDDAAVVAKMVATPILIERPIVVTAKGTRLCRPIERVLEIL